MRRRVVSMGACVCATGAVAFGPPVPCASAQDALGDGRALDANLRVGSGGRNDRARDFRMELELRNAIVTGNVPGGMAFRGEVGYLAANDFRGNLGSNDLYRFQRDAFYSGLATRNLAGMESLERSLGFTVAGQSAGYFGGPLIINRSGAHAGAQEATLRSESDTTRADVFGNVAGSMRSPGLQILRDAERADSVAYSKGDGSDGSLVVGASSLLGVKPLPAWSIVFNPITSESRLPDAGDDSQTRTSTPAIPVVSPHQRILDALEENLSRVETTRQDTRITPSGPFEGEEEARATPTQEGPKDDSPEGRSGPTPVPQSSVIPSLEELRELLDPSSTDPKASEEQGSEQRSAVQVARELLGIEIPSISQLTTDQDATDLYGEHMRRGETLLGEARWFHAEERFTAALAINPGDALAAAGRVHSQLGAGMFLSAAVNLRNLLRAYPEFIPVRFDPKLLPRDDRMGVIERQLQQRCERDTPVGRDAALLLAYLGHQHTDRAMVEDGLRFLERIETALGIESDPLHEAVSGVWLEGDE